MDSVLFTDHGILVFVITGSAIALVLSVLGLATTRQTHSDIKHQLAAVRGLAAHNERNLLKDQFQALVREGSDSIEDIFDAQFRRRFSELINRTTERGYGDHQTGNNQPQVRECRL
jgi:DNA-binding FrmR family transcriptional regulator